MDRSSYVLLTTIVVTSYLCRVHLSMLALPGVI
jgi:hypothetical protein